MLCQYVVVTDKMECSAFAVYKWPVVIAYRKIVLFNFCVRKVPHAGEREGGKPIST